MTTQKALILTGTAILSLWPALVAAQQSDPNMILDGSVEVGAGYLSEDSFKFGEYTGLVDRGGFFIGNFDSIMRDAPDDDTALYLEMQGRNLGLENRAFDLEAGSQGNYGAVLNFEQIPHYLQRDALTPYRGEGTNFLSLPPTWPAYVDPINPANPDQTTSDITAQGGTRLIDLQTQRERFGGSLFWLPSQDWRFDVDYRNERKRGTQTTFGMFGINGGNPLSAAIPEPIDYETNEVEATANYSSQQMQFQAVYTGSFFNNGYDSLTWQNAYWIGDNGWDEITEEGRMALSPDNQAHNLSVSGGYSFSPRTRLTGSLAYGVMLQDEDFLPYTINPRIAIAPGSLPRNSLDGQINTLRADVAFSARPQDRVDLSARYRFSDRDNRTPRAQYAVVPNDVGNQVVGPNGLRVNTPHSFTEHLVNLDGGLRFGTYGKFSLGYEYDNTERTFSERDKTEEHTIEAKLSGRATESVDGWISYAYSARDGDTYVGNAPYQESTVISPPNPTAFENHPELRKYNIADRTRNEIRAVANYLRSDRWMFSLGANYGLDDYEDTTIGLIQGETIGGKADFSYAASRDLTAYAYYAFDQMRFEQNGHRFTSFPPLNNLTSSAQRWAVDTTDQVHTLGAGLAWEGIAENVKLTADYAYSHALTTYDVAGGISSNGPTAGGGATTDDLPDLKTDIHSLQLAADYATSAAVTFRFAYLFEYYDSDDFALDNVNPDTMDRVLWFGGDSPNYTAHVIGVSTMLRF